MVVQACVSVFSHKDIDRATIERLFESMIQIDDAENWDTPDWIINDGLLLRSCDISTPSSQVTNGEDIFEDY